MDAAVGFDQILAPAWTRSGVDLANRIRDFGKNSGPSGERHVETPGSVVISSAALDGREGFKLRVLAAWDAIRKS